MHCIRGRVFLAGRGAVMGALLAALAPGDDAVAQRGSVYDGDRLLAQAYNASGEGLFKQFPPGNVVFSPYSIGTAMAMALAGARGETERRNKTPAPSITS